MKIPEYKYGDITEKLIGVCFRIHNTIGNGFPEVIYQRALALELKSIGVSYEQEFDMAINYLEVYNLEIGLLINFESKSREFHRLANKKYKQPLS